MIYPTTRMQPNHTHITKTWYHLVHIKHLTGMKTHVRGQMTLVQTALTKMFCGVLILVEYSTFTALISCSETTTTMV